jgi:branched-chain amino acid transport system permease protein
MTLPSIDSRIKVAAPAFAIVVAPFIFGDSITAALVFASIYVVIVSGLNLFMGFTGQLSFGHNAFAALGGYSSAILTTRFGWPPMAALCTGVLLAGATGAIIGQSALRLRGHYLAMATFAFGLIVSEIALQWRSLTQGSFGISGIPPLGIGEWRIESDLQYYYVYWALAAVALWIAHRAGGLRFGRALRAIAGDERAAQALGVNVAAYKLRSFVLSTMFAALGGALFAHYVTFISPEVFGLELVITMVTMLFVGGIGTALGPLWGAVIMSLVPEMLRSVSDARQVAYGLVLLLILIFAPKGVHSLLVRWNWTANSRPNRPGEVSATSEKAKA